MVAMLSPSGAYRGGRSCFRRAEGSRGHRELGLDRGDVAGTPGMARDQRGSPNWEPPKLVYVFFCFSFFLRCFAPLENQPEKEATLF